MANLRGLCEYVRLAAGELGEGIAALPRSAWLKRTCFKLLERSALSINCFGLFPDCKVDKIGRSETGLVFFLHAHKRSSYCPSCTLRSRRVHSTYTRFIRDMATGERAVHLQLRVRRFYCLNVNCQRRTFTERLKLFAPHARRTERLINLQTTVGTFLGGEAGSRLLQKLRMPLCGASLLQSIRAQATEHYPIPRVLGVDDWAIKKGRSHGTILIDLEKHKVVDLLPTAARQPWSCGLGTARVLKSSYGTSFTTTRWARKREPRRYPGSGQVASAPQLAGDARAVARHRIRNFTSLTDCARASRRSRKATGAAAPHV